VSARNNALTLHSWKADVVARFVRKADAVVRIVWMTFAMALFIWKANALTISV